MAIDKAGETRLMADLFRALPDWYEYTSHRYQAKELQGYYPSRYAMVDFSHLGDETHVTFYPAWPEDDAPSVKCNEWFQSGHGDWQINAWLSGEHFEEVTNLEFSEFHVTFRIGKRREHVFYDIHGVFKSETKGMTDEHRRRADEIAALIGRALVERSVPPPVEITLADDIPAYTERRPTLKLGFTLKKGAKIAVDSLDQGYFRVRLVSGWAIYHCAGQPNQTIVPGMAQVPAMYADALGVESKSASPAPVEITLADDIPAYTERRPTLKLGFTLKKGAKIAVDSLDQGYFRVRLVSGWAIYHCAGQPNQTIVPGMAQVPAMYADARVLESL